MADYTDDITLSVGYQDTVDGTLAYMGSVTSTNGEQISVTPKTTGGDAVVSNGVQIVPEGGAIIHLKNSTGSNIAIVGEKSYPVTNSTGSQINVDGVPDTSIKISHSADTSVTWEQGTSQGGTITDVAVPCKIYQASTVPNRCFVLGQIEEID